MIFSRRIALVIALLVLLQHIECMPTRGALKEGHRTLQQLKKHLMEMPTTGQESVRDYAALSFDDKIALIKTMAQAAMKCQNIPGLSMAVIQGGKVSTFALGTMDGTNPVQTSTNFGIGSTTKAFTAFLVGQLVDQGTVQWTTPIREYVPSFQLMDPIATAQVSFRDMLTHKTGLPAWGYDADWGYGYQYTREEFINRLQFLIPDAQFRQQWQYNNQILAAAGHLASTIAGATQWEDLVTKKILQPLGMTNTYPYLQDAINAGNLASPHVSELGDPNRYKASYQVNEGVQLIAPAGGLYSNVIDMSKWVQMLLKKGTTCNSQNRCTQMINNSTLTEIWRPQTSIYPWEQSVFVFSQIANKSIAIETYNYGFNWNIEAYRNHRHVWHDGETNGYNAQVSLLPDEDLGIVILSNIDSRNSYLILLAYYAIDLLTTGDPWFNTAAFCHKTAPSSPQPPPSHVEPQPTIFPLETYVGTYQHPTFGELTISINSSGNGLMLQYNQLVGQLYHKSNNIFFFSGYVKTFPQELAEMTLNTQFLTPLQQTNIVDSFVFPLQFDPMLPPLPDLIFTNKRWLPRGLGYGPNVVNQYYTDCMFQGV